MTHSGELDGNACIVAGVQPLLAELREPISTYFAGTGGTGYRGTGGTGRMALERYVHDVFQRQYGADLTSFYPNLTAFLCEGEVRGVVGHRDGMVQPLFSEQYLDAPAERVFAARMGRAVDRSQLVEVGNLAFDARGDARWAIAAMTALLHAAGYRWVLFTAVRPLFNAFERLGLRPVKLADADPERLHDRGMQWGDYYRAAPIVCGGDIDAGYRKLTAHIGARQPRLHALLNQVRCLGAQLRCGRTLTGGGLH